MRIGFIGLGQMGRGMTARLLSRGYEVTVWNRTRALAEAFRAQGAAVAERPEDTLAAEVVITMLADDAAVESVWLASGMIAGTPASTIHLNMASVSPELGRTLARLHSEAGSAY